MYWLVIVAAVFAWMLVARRGVSEPVVAVRPPTHRTTLVERWNQATGTGKVALAAVAFARVVWIGVLVAVLAAVIVGTATWMY